MRIITTLLRSDEDLNYYSIDANEKTAKEICAFNSPVFKMMLQYERKLILAREKVVLKGCENEKDVSCDKYFPLDETKNSGYYT